MATVPDPQFPTDKPTPNDKPGSSNTFLYLLGGTAVAVGGWYYTQQGAQVHPHDQRKADEERAKQKAAELRDAGVATAHDAVKEGERAYEDTKVCSSGIYALFTIFKGWPCGFRLLPGVKSTKHARRRMQQQLPPNQSSTLTNTLPSNPLTTLRPVPPPRTTTPRTRPRTHTTMRRRRSRRRSRAGARGSAAGLGMASRRQMMRRATRRHKSPKELRRLRVGLPRLRARRRRGCELRVVTKTHSGWIQYCAFITANVCCITIFQPCFALNSTRMIIVYKFKFGRERWPWSVFSVVSPFHHTTIMQPSC